MKESNRCINRIYVRLSINEQKKTIPFSIFWSLRNSTSAPQAQANYYLRVKEGQTVEPPSN